MKSNVEHIAIRLSEVLGAKTGFITSIVGQKKNKNRFSLFVNDVFIIGISDSCLVNFNLKKGDHFDQLILDQILTFEKNWSARNYLLRLLSRRDHSGHELKQKALKKGLESKVIDKIILELDEKGYINNAEFAWKFAHDKFEFNKWGPQKIQLELVKKGVSKKDIATALDSVSKDDQVSKMNSIFEKSVSKFLRTDPSKRRKKIFDFFLRKGYDTDQILKELPKWLIELES
jgi:regulatory protein